MRYLINKSATLAASLVLLLCGFGTASALPVTEIDGIAPSGNPSFTFEGINQSDYSNTIQSWFDNLFYIEHQDATDTYRLFAAQEGDFTFAPEPGMTYDGSDGIFNLYADFDANGNFLGGMMAISGSIPDAGINDPSTILMTGTLVAADTTTGYAIQDNILGLSYIVDSCAEVSWQCNTDTPESVYFYTVDNLPDIGSLGGGNYQSTMASITTVPIPASAWLMISALSLCGALARRRQQAVTE